MHWYVNIVEARSYTIYELDLKVNFSASCDTYIALDILRAWSEYFFSISTQSTSNESRTGSIKCISQHIRLRACWRLRIKLRHPWLRPDIIIHSHCYDQSQITNQIQLFQGYRYDLRKKKKGMLWLRMCSTNTSGWRRVWHQHIVTFNNFHSDVYVSVSICLYVCRFFINQNLMI